MKMPRQSRPSMPAARAAFGDDSAPEETAKGPKPATQAGAFSRHQAKEEKPKPRTSKIMPAFDPGANPVDPGTTANTAAKGKWVVPAAAFSVIVVAVLVAGVVTRERLPIEQLRALYPYGFSGARGPYGQLAPPADEVDYHFVETVDCDTHTECLRYTFEAGSFSGGMVIGREPDQTWSRVTDEKLPFPATAPKQP
ncbi:MAG: hypothetical protein QM765_08835 [Myxococcales bacterium]